MQPLSSLQTVLNREVFLIVMFGDWKSDTNVLH